MKKKVLLVFGTRPEAIKMVSLVKEFDNHKDSFEMNVCVTAQHREMLDDVLKLFDIKPDFDLDVMEHGQDLYDVTSKILLRIKPVFEEFEPDLVLVHGDTTTTLATSLAAFYKKIPVGHVEAGLRTGDIYSPWPEEANRTLTTKITKYHFAPTTDNKQFLLKEGVPEDKIEITGNTVIDSLFEAINRIENVEGIKEELITDISNKGYIFSDRKIVLITGHRRENFGDGFLNMCNGIKTLAEQNPEVDFVYPTHLNPNVQKPVKEILSDISNVYLIDPLEYFSFVLMLNNCYLVLTDSGGIQEEAPSIGKPVLVMRDTTERQEAVKSGTVKLVGANTDVIIKEVNNLLNNKEDYDMMSKNTNPYGTGNSCEKIIKYIKKELNV